MKEHILLDRDHSEMSELLAEFFRAVDRQEARRGIEMLDLFWARLAVHIRAEHLHLFPALLHPPEAVERAAGAPAPETIQQATDTLRQEHDFFMTEIFAILKLLRKLPECASEQVTAAIFQTVRERMQVVSDRLRNHNEREETQVYRWAEALLPPAALTTLNHHMQQELANLPARFRG